jgi:threonine 3-dehydrogenase
MRALVKHHSKYGAQIQTIDIPKIGVNDVLVKVKAVSICGTDLHIYKWDDWAKNRVNPPYTFGHEFCGVVVEKGSAVSCLNIGDYVSGETHFVCYECNQCLNEKFHLCNKTKILGVDTDGCFAEYVKIPSQNIWKNNNDLPYKLATIQEPFGNAVHTVLSSNVPTKTVAIIGCGPIGLMALAVAKACGAGKVIAIDINSYRLSLASKMNADYIFNSLEIDIVSEVMKITHGNGVDVVCEMSGNERAIKKGLQILTNGGDFNILSLPTKEVAIDFTNSVVFKGIKIQGITGRRMFSTWNQIRELLVNKLVDLNPLITHELNFSDYEEGFALMEKGNCGKVVLYLEEGN